MYYEKILNNLKSISINSRRKTLPELDFGIFTNTILDGIVTLYLTDYYVNDVKIKYELFILANTIFLFYNILADIFFGFYVDRIKHKLGR